MLVLQEQSGDWSPLHFAFTTSAADIEDAAARLREHGVEVSGPVTHDWMPARSIYFRDPDGHDLELCAAKMRVVVVNTTRPVRSRPRANSRLLFPPPPTMDTSPGDRSRPSASTIPSTQLLAKRRTIREVAAPVSAA